MAKPYATEMLKLKSTLEWAAEVNLDHLRHAVKSAQFSPLSAIGSGGSLTVAHGLAGIHRYWTQQAAIVSTPLELVSNPLQSSVSQWLLSAGGRNVDIMRVARTLIAKEPRQIVAMTGSHENRLAKLCEKHPYVDLQVFEPPAGRDGFLATNSILAFLSVLLRAYAEEFNSFNVWNEVQKIARKFTLEDSDYLDDLKSQSKALWQRQTTLVLFGPDTSAGAIDIESKFTEAALGGIQLADYRNFAHGRHHWLAKRGGNSSVLAFISDDDSLLAKRTLDLIPSDIPILKIHIPGSKMAAMLCSVLAALRITQWAGQSVGIDPGAPGVPLFGRKLYHLSLPKIRAVELPDGTSKAGALAISRKARVQLDNLSSLSTLPKWKEAAAAYKRRLKKAVFQGVVLDYDGTIVETKFRRELPTNAMSEQLSKIVNSNCKLGIATGRGVSARNDLRKVIAKENWHKVIIGYYNGADISTLADDNAPNGEHQTCQELKEVASVLRGHQMLIDVCQQDDRKYQITLSGKKQLSSEKLWYIVREILNQSGFINIVVLRSGHSVDILAPSVSKIRVLERMRESIGRDPILTIGDRGCWPGNDFDLLNQDYSLGVDEINSALDNCWNFAKPGQRGVNATINYLSKLKIHKTGLKFDSTAFK